MAPAAGRRSPATPPLAAIVGATASGKSELAMALAARLPVEILVADSRQVYRSMDVGTAKPSAADRAAVPHHLLDLAAPDQVFTAADWLAEAREAIDAVAARGRLPLIVGGTGLYISALVDGYDFGAQPWSPELRERLAAELEAEGLPSLAERLARLDPVAAARTDMRNPRRVLRAIERAETGRSGEPPRAAPYGGRLALLALSRPRDELYSRIDRRAAVLFSAGLPQEVQRLLDAGYPREFSPLTSHGYSEAARYLAGEWTLDEAVAATARRTRQHAKRQLTWFRRDPRIVWMPAGDRSGADPSLVEGALDLVRRLLG